MLDKEFSDHTLSAMVHNAGQYVGIMSKKCHGHDGTAQFSLGDGSLLRNEETEFSIMDYYHNINHI